MELPRQVMDKRNINITMLGVSGVGKTSYMAGMFRAFVEGAFPLPNNNYITMKEVPQNETEASYIGLKTIFRLNNFKRTRSGFPIGTDDDADAVVTNYCMSLNFTDTYAWPVRLIDYRGGFINDSTHFNDSSKADSDDAEHDMKLFVDTLKDSDVLLILVDGIYLAQYVQCRDHKNVRPGADCKNLLERIGVNHITTLFTSLSSEFSGKPLCVELVITKTDSTLIPQDLKNDHCKKLCEEAKNVFRAINTMCEAHTSARYGSNQWHYGVIPVTLAGEGNCESSVAEDGKTINNNMLKPLDPQDIDNSFLYGVYRAMGGIRSSEEDKLRKSREVLDRMCKNPFKRFGTEVKLQKINNDKCERDLRELNQIMKLFERESGDVPLIEYCESRFHAIAAPESTEDIH